MGLDYGPDKVGDACGGDEEGFDSEQVPDLVHGEPDGGQTAGPEQEEGQVVHRVRAGVGGHAIGQAAVLRPYCTNHERDALAAYPALHAVPDTCPVCL